MLKVTLRLKSGESKEWKLEEGRYSVGRKPDNDLVIPDERVSSHHLLLFHEEGRWFVEDLNSTNGTFLNGRRIEKEEVKEGDRILIGSSQLIIGEKEKMEDLGAGWEEENTTIQMILPPEKGGYPPGIKAEEIERSHRRLYILYQVSNLLNSLFTVDEAMKKILDLIFDVLKADRGAIILEENGKFMIKEVKRRKDDGTPLRISTTIVNKVYKEGESILLADALADSRFKDRASIIQSHIHSAMCVPLKGRERTLGVIYVDTVLSKGAFDKEDLEMLTAIGNQAAMALENAQLYEENLRRERLAGIGQAITGMAHYVKNILQGLRGGVTLVDLGLQERREEVLKKGWEVVKRASGKIEHLVLDMLTYSKERKPKLEPCNLNALVDEVYTLMEETAREKGVRLKVEKDERIGEIYLDREGIHRVLLNLITNALEAMEGEGEITISTSREEDKVCLKVRDTGKGISPEIREKLFTPFLSEKGSKGTGLGLAVSQKIVKEHGGEIKVDSEVGKGTTFTIFLPLLSR